jgi:zona occludens toxin
MISYHEGLDGSGKSYEACVFHIVPALQEGRTVYTNIEGINHEKFSEISGVPIIFVERLLFCVYHPEAKSQDERIALQSEDLLKVPNDSLVIIDEIQNMHPTSRQQLSADWKKLITEHRHRGLDFILCGQSMADTHILWRRRIRRLINFSKLTYFGRPNKYQWRASEVAAGGKFQEVSRGYREYEKKYFGLYDSFTKETKNKDVYADKRTNVFKAPVVVYLFPISFIVLAVSIYYIIGFSKQTTDPEPTKQESVQYKKVAASDIKVVGKAKETNVNKSESVQKDKENITDAQAQLASTTTNTTPKRQYTDPVVHHSQSSRMRLSGVVYTKNKLYAKVDFVDKAHNVIDSFTIDALRDLGWSVDMRESGLHMTKGNQHFVARSWPIPTRRRTVTRMFN